MATNPMDREDDRQSASYVSEKLARISPNVSARERTVLEKALTEVSSRSFNEALASMPNVGHDSDFEPRRD